MVSVLLYPCIFCVALFVLCVACLTVFVNCLVKEFAIFLCVDVILLLNVMEVLNVGGGTLLDRLCMFCQIMCLLCLWSQCASRYYSIGCVCVCRKLSPHLV